MAHVVCEPCFDCKHTDCVVVCPVDCFWQQDQMLYIHPDDCIDCEACIPECPVDAIDIGPVSNILPKCEPPYVFHVSENDLGTVPEPWRDYIRLNAERARALKERGQGHITQKTAPRNGPLCNRHRSGNGESRLWNVGGVRPGGLVE